MEENDLFRFLIPNPYPYLLSIPINNVQIMDPYMKSLLVSPLC